MRRRVLSAFLAACVCMSSVPVNTFTAFADEAEVYLQEDVTADDSFQDDMIVTDEAGESGIPGAVSETAEFPDEAEEISVPEMAEEIVSDEDALFDDFSDLVVEEELLTEVSDFSDDPFVTEDEFEPDEAEMDELFEDSMLMADGEPSPEVYIQADGIPVYIDKDGEFYFTSPETGGYEIHVFADGYLNERLDVYLPNEYGGWSRIDEDDYHGDTSLEFSHYIYAEAGQTYKMKLMSFSSEDFTGLVEVSMLPSDKAGVYDGLLYRVEQGVDGEEHIIIVDYIGSAENIVVPSSINGYPVRVIGDWSLSGLTAKTITISEGITSFENWVMNGCMNLETVSLPSTLESIYNDPFQGCSNLQTITFPNGSAHYNAGDGFFYMSRGDLLHYYGGVSDTIHVPDGITSIEAYTLDESNAVTVYLPRSVRYIWHCPGTMMYLHAENANLKIGYAGLVGDWYSNDYPTNPRTTVYAPAGGTLQAYCLQYNVPYQEEGDPFDPETATQTITITGNGGYWWKPGEDGTYEKVFSVSADVPYGKPYNIQAMTELLGWERDGYYLDSWWTDTPQGGYSFDYDADEDDPINITMTEDITITAIWSTAKTITLNGGEGTATIALHNEENGGRIEEQTVHAVTRAIGKYESLDLSEEANTFTRPGYVLAGFMGGSERFYTLYEWVYDETELNAVWTKTVDVAFYDSRNPAYPSVVQMMQDGDYLCMDTDQCPYLNAPMSLKGYALDSSGNQMVEYKYQYSELLEEYAICFKLQAADGIKLYAIWDDEDPEDLYAITFDLNGGHLTDSPEETTYVRYMEEGIYVSNDLYYDVTGPEGLTFVGWTTVRNDESTLINQEVDYYVAENATLYAFWVEYVTITFDGNDGLIYDWNEDEYVSTVTWLVPKGRLLDYGPSYEVNDANPTMLLGWSTSTSREDLVINTFSLEKNAFKPQTDITLHAIWVPKHLVTFNFNGHKMADWKPLGEITDAWPDGEPLEDRYHGGLANNDTEVFRGWSTSTSKEDIVSTEGVNAYRVTADITVYAIWGSPYLLTWDLNGGLVSNNGTMVSHTEEDVDGGDVVKFADAPVPVDREGYTLIGWSTSVNKKDVVLTKENASSQYTVNGSQTLYAIWEEDEAGDDNQAAENVQNMIGDLNEAQGEAQAVAVSTLVNELENIDNQDIIDSADDIAGLNSSLDQVLVNRTIGDTVIGATQGSAGEVTITDNEGNSIVETVDVAATGAAATAAAAVLEDDSLADETVFAKVNLSGMSADETSLRMDISVDIIKRNSEGVEEKVSEATELTAPVTIELSVPSRLRGMDFNLLHTLNDGHTVQVPFIFIEGGTKISFTVPSLSPFEWTGFTCRAHSWDEGTQIIPATCTAPETRRFKCTKPYCTAEESREYGEALGHDYCNRVVVTEPTCENEGKIRVWCSHNSRHEYFEAIPASGHSWGAWIKVSDATYDSPKIEKRTCSQCGKTETRKVGSALKRPDPQPQPQPQPQPVVKPAEPAVLVLNVSGTVPLKTKQKCNKIVAVTMRDGDTLASASSSNTKIVTASVSGKNVTIKAGKKTGKAKITVTTAGGASAVFSVKVQKAAVKTKKINVAKTKVTLKVRETFDLKTSFTPVTAPFSIKYKLDAGAKKAVKVSGAGVISAKKAGKGTITITVGNKTKKIKVTVK